MTWKMNPLLPKWSKNYSQQTDAEKAMEPAIASMGQVYRFQHPVWALGVFPDFVLLDERVVIEVDDKSHRRKDKREADAKRTAGLEELGWRVVRCTNEEALADPYGTVNRMMAELKLPYRATKKE